MSGRSGHHVRKYKKPSKNFLDRLVLAVAVVEPVMTIPQIHKIFSEQNAQGVSMATWSFYVLAAVIWLFYGFKIKDLPVIVASALWIVMEGLVVIGTIMY